MNIQKVGMIGCGFVGATCAFSLVQSGLFSEMVLIDANHEKAIGEAMDLSHGTSYLAPMKIYAGDYSDLKDAGLIIITAGANQKPDETRLDLVKRNVAIFKDIIPKIKAQNCEGILLIVSNPVDILTYVAYKLSGFPASRVIGSGTVLDTARFKYLLGERLNVDSRNIHAYIIGEHGDSELAVWSQAMVAGIHINHFSELRGSFNHHQEVMQEIYEDVRDSAYEIIKRKGATYYGIAVAVKRIAEAIVRNQHTILPVSTLMTGQFGISDLCLSIPSVLCQNGVEMVVDLYLNDDETKKLQASAKALSEVIADLDLDPAA